MKMNKLLCYLVTALFVLGTVNCVATEENQLVDAKIIDKALQDLESSDKTRTMGVQVSVFKNGEVRYSNAAGFANYENKEPLTPKHKIRYASVSKLFVALGVQKLAEQGKIKLNDPASKYLGFDLTNPNYPDVTITVSDLMNHLSSVRDASNYSMPYPGKISEFFAPGSEHYADGGHWADNKSKLQTPGEFFNYSNLGYGLLGTVIENVTGERFDQWIRANVLKPLGITGSYNVRDLSDYPVSNIHKYRQDKWSTSLNDQKNKLAVDPFTEYKAGDNGSLFSPQGGMRASSEELATALKWFIGNEDNGPISKKGLRALEKQQWIYNEKKQNGNNYGNLFSSFGQGIQCTQDIPMGDRIVAEGGIKLCGHLGDAYGLLSGFLYDVDNGWGVVYALSGTSNYAENYGKYSAFYLWEEQILTAVVQAIK